MYKLSGLAAEDFAAIYEYTLLNFGVAKADEYTGSLESTLQLLSAEPGMGRECLDIAAGIRRHDHLKPSFRTCLKHYQSLDSDRLL